MPFDKIVAKAAVDLNKELKRKRMLIDIADLFIAATAIVNNIPFATLNIRHFNSIDNLTLIE